MKILSILKSKQKKQFVSEIDFITNLDMQSHLAIETLVGLREFNIEEEDEFKINYIFYTNSLEKSLKMAKELQKVNYPVTHEMVADNKKLFLIKGQTTPIKMMHETLKKWTTEMCRLAYQCDCDFGKWEIIR